MCEEAWRVMIGLGYACGWRMFSCPIGQHVCCHRHHSCCPAAGLIQSYKPGPGRRKVLRIRKSTSICLDLLRAGAALTVFVHHANLYELDAGAFSWFRRDIGHSAVVVFFVLSGYVIMGTLGEQRSARDYVVKRAARIYSVVVPALLLTYAIDLLILQMNLPVGVPEYVRLSGQDEALSVISDQGG
jgi:hypothetical protein